MSVDLTTELGKVLKTIRTARGRTQEQTAQLIGVSASHLSLLERGKRSITLDILHKFADTFRVPATVIVFLASKTVSLEQHDRAISDQLLLLAWKLINLPTPEDHSKGLTA